ncbi:acyltransferase [Thermoanaerobacterium saccharolyticum]|uniref:acyltransferase family protein n=1 Tax=Thermoanaerobacterium saccharolyticum TaxID=28896 RepID=UPI002FD96B81
MKTFKNNLFDLLRLVAASFVLISHQFALSGKIEPHIGVSYTLGGIGVVIFFAISGYLVTASFTRDPDLARFFYRRALRIFPGLIVCLIFTVFLIGPIFSNLSVEEYFANSATWEYFIHNAILHTVYPLPRVFEHTFYPNSVNGSLWTLPIEFICYVILAIALTLYNSYKSILVILITCVMVCIFVLDGMITSQSIWMTNAPFLFVAFLIGALLNKTKNRWIKDRVLQNILLLISFIFLFAYISRSEGKLIFPITLGVVVIIIGELFHSPKLIAKRDYSYGIYIYAFPIQQIVINYTNFSFLSKTLICIIITLCLAMVSWHFVELPFLNLKPKASINVLSNDME